MVSPRYRVEGTIIRHGKNMIASSLVEGTMEDVYLATYVMIQLDGGGQGLGQIAAKDEEAGLVYINPVSTLVDGKPVTWEV